ncbi:hypothetical protein ISN45_At03g006930 [Arabidopsis thaliana x Arabidopsis arenosa]|uniref:Defensin-like protein 74 n=3 Tax=Arabidopsis TaxID=3701 RepID=DEF74_ARATH|nr:low-molecular-weight cysteine-rich 43 [Arabidopsis thaliana]P82758.2 RecName: Full=Defensin-like protein 74; AltName: Full=Low-molecular-weight cysteine-rich protein 43; Short=Protein LCR43; Flags: Precursor [Arabidopsis thaliana]AEE74487.1 low-molecular-weight cysteine-rich 43 [Arabidopsis thaliana]KAG7624341.1 hypothetical protein ISN45_At03g006930 [Arabidopsis thaliana x Arabidopsis arenosa]OAP06607.1 LCR43 [Arabidopsis thaliana]|eukprot:NP_001030653.1 low-molecular-weight cysteine-rich 43 [Arabidopsis thaliana]
MNYKIGIMSLLVITSIIFLFLVPDKVEAQKECIGPCDMFTDCQAACVGIRKGYNYGQCVAWKPKDDDPFTCCCYKLTP